MKKETKETLECLRTLAYSIFANGALIIAVLAASAVLAVLSGAGDLLKYWAAFKIVFGN